MLRQLHKLAESPRKEQKAQRCSTPFSEGLILGYQCWLQVHSLYKRVPGFHYLAFLLLQWVMFELLPEPDEAACPSLGHMWTEQKRCQAEGAHWKRENSVPLDLNYNAYCWRNQGRYQVPLRCYFPCLILLLWTETGEALLHFACLVWPQFRTPNYLLLWIQHSKCNPCFQSYFLRSCSFDIDWRNEHQAKIPTVWGFSFLQIFKAVRRAGDDLWDPQNQHNQISIASHWSWSLRQNKQN